MVSFRTIASRMPGRPTIRNAARQPYNCATTPPIIKPMNVPPYTPIA